MKKRVMSILLVVIIAFSSISFGAISANAETRGNEPVILVESIKAKPGSDVKVKVNVKNNPGIAGATLRISYDSGLTLTAAESGSTFSKLNFTAPGRFDNPSKFLWDSESGQINDDGTMLILTFKVTENVEANAKLSVNVSYYPGDIYNEKLDNVDFNTVGGNVNIDTGLLGDVNDDGVVSVLDATLIQKYIVNTISFDKEILERADVNKDNAISVLDATLIQKYIVGLVYSLGNETENLQPKEYSVTFKDYDGTVIKTENVESGKSANEPDEPQREEYIFSKWDKSFDNITSDIVITAEYKKIVNPTVFVRNTSAAAGEVVEMPIKIYNNPGINGMQLNVSYDEKLILQNAENGTALSSLYFTKPGVYTNPSKFLWDGIGDNDKGNGTVLNLTFKIPTGAKYGDEYKISVESPEGTIFDSNLNDVAFDIVSGSIKIK